MTEEDIKHKNLVLIDFIKSITNGYKVKAEYSTNDSDTKVIVVQEESGQKVVFYDNPPLYNYYNIDIFGDNIQNSKDVSVDIGNLIGNNIYFDCSRFFNHLCICLCCFIISSITCINLFAVLNTT